MIATEGRPTSLMVMKSEGRAKDEKVLFQQELHQKSMIRTSSIRRLRKGAKGDLPVEDSSTNVCYRCGQQGHQAKFCPHFCSNYGRSRRCFRCGCFGHHPSSCLQQPGGLAASSGSLKCFKCGAFGHPWKLCNKSEPDFPRRCFRCGELGHSSRFGVMGSRCSFYPSRKCFKCGAFGHVSRFCRSWGGAFFAGQRGAMCFHCGKWGHTVKNCRNFQVQEVREEENELQRDEAAPSSSVGENSLRRKSPTSNGDLPEVKCETAADPRSTEATVEPSTIRTRQKVCFQCGKVGHIKRKCTQEVIKAEVRP